MGRGCFGGYLCNQGVFEKGGWSAELSYSPSWLLALSTFVLLGMDDVMLKIFPSPIRPTFTLFVFFLVHDLAA